MEITAENAFLFTEHKSGVLAIASKSEQAAIDPLTETSSRDTFARRYRKLLNDTA